MVESNYENGLGRSDLVIKDRKLRRAIVIELKIVKNKDCLADECYKALQQIEEKNMQLKLNRMVLRK
ncbi:MAG: PD-(D/E)XK nuclease domain-containing protein [Anaerobutyricum sp.]